MKNKIYYSAGILSIVFLWSFFSFIFTEDIVPAPLAVFRNIFFILKDKFILNAFFITAARSLSGFFCALLLGSAAGVVAGSFKSFEKTFFIPVMLLQGAPAVLWVIPLVLMIGVNGFSALIFVFLITLPLVILNVQEGTKAISKAQKEMFKVYANRSYLKFFYLLLPALSTYLKSTIMLGVVLSLKSSVLGEWFAAKNGIGRIINEYFYTYDMLSFYTLSFIYIVLIGIIAALTQSFCGYIFSRKKSSIEPEKYFNIIDKLTKSSGLKMEHVTFGYTNNAVINDLSFKIDKPESIVLTGESGAGKTTFAKLALGLLKARSGDVVKPENAALIFQDDVFVDNIDVLANAKLPALFKHDKNPDARAYYYLEKCGLKNYYNYFPDELSGGMKKRLSFARALVLNPGFLILDEPFINLHKEARAELWDLYFNLFNGKNIPAIIITHYPEELAERNLSVYELKNGKIIRKP